MSDQFLEQSVSALLLSVLKVYQHSLQDPEVLYFENNNSVCMCACLPMHAKRFTDSEPRFIE